MADMMDSVETADPSKVVCVGEGLHFGYFQHPIHATVDTRKAGPGELTVYCDGPEQKAFCELTDHQDGTFTLTVKPQDIGLHQLYVKYNDENTPGSPFPLRVSSASLLDVRGMGVTSGVLKKGNNYEIQVHTGRAGPGNVRIRVGGPKGAFRVMTRKDDHLLRCRYGPQVPGLYVVKISWDGDPVPGSPFNVYLARDAFDLTEYLNKLS